jgi:hypothetical protein
LKQDAIGKRQYVGFNERYDFENPNPTRNLRSVWTIPTEPTKEAHFATFPRKLVERCLLAGTSPKACKHCGAPYARVGVTRNRGAIKGGKGEKDAASMTFGDGGKVGHNDVTTLGFRPTCDCQPPDDTGRCRVLDPFGGSGTTGAVAEALGLDWTLIDLNPQYKQIADKKTTITKGLNL